MYDKFQCNNDDDGRVSLCLSLSVGGRDTRGVSKNSGTMMVF